jgi:colanic acid/amylovoran biosynthesis glycosyltransferase
VKIQRIAIDLGRYEFRPRSLSEFGARARLLLCGRFVEKKGIPYAIKGLRIVREHYPNIELRIVGDGPLYEDIQGLIKKLGVEKQVSLLGFLPHAEYIEELKQAHILITPSVTAADGDSEGGAPTVLLEAQASGLPVLSTYHADIPNVVLAGESGFLVPERNAEALAERLLYLLQHHKEWGKMGQVGRRYVEAKHNVHLEIARLESRYLSLMGA